MIFTRTPRKMFGQPYDQVLAAHRENVRELAALQAQRPGPAPELLTDKPESWSWRDWGDYMDDTADELHTLRDEGAAE